MGRNTEKYAYPNPRFDRTSIVWGEVLQDAQRTGKSVSDLIPIRLADFYAGRTLDAAPMPTPPPVAQALSDSIEENARAAAQALKDDED